MRSKLAVQSVEPWSHKTLAEFYMAAKELDKINEETSEIRDVLIQFQEHQHFGLILLHKYLDLDDEEILVESKKANSAISIQWHQTPG